MSRECCVGRMLKFDYGVYVEGERELGIVVLGKSEE